MNTNVSNSKATELTAQERRKLVAIGKKMQARLEQVDELFGDAREVIGLHREGDGYLDELNEDWEECGMDAAIVEFAIETRRRWRREEVIASIVAVMGEHGIKPEMLVGEEI